MAVYMGSARLSKHQLLRALSTGSVKPSQFARERGVTKQYVHKVLKELRREGIVMKTDEGYVLTEKGKLIVKNLKTADLIEGLKYLEALAKAFSLWKSKKGVEKSEQERARSVLVSKYFIDALLGGGVMYFLSIVAQAYTENLNVNEKVLDRRLDKWSSELKYLVKILVKVLRNCDVEEWVDIVSFFYSIDWYSCYHVLSLYALGVDVKVFDKVIPDPSLILRCKPYCEAINSLRSNNVGSQK
jgi:predicted transcriptional regulator